MSRALRGVIAIPAILVALGFASCNRTPSYVETGTPVGGDFRPCKVFVPDGFSGKWPGLEWEHVTDRNCPLTVSSYGSALPFEMNFTVPPSVAYQYVYSAFRVRNNLGQTVALGNYYPFVPHGNAGNYRSTILASYSAATGNYPYLDSAAVSIAGGAVYPEFPWFRVFLPARIKGAATQISGSEVVPANYAQYWTALVSEEPISYRYKWYVDGVLVSTSQTLSAILTEGSHLIRLEATLSDDTVEIIESNVLAIDCGGPIAC